MMKKGLFGKYLLEKADGGEISEDAVYFILRIDTDVHAKRALFTYAKSVQKENPVLARDLIRLLFKYTHDDLNIFLD